MKILITGGNGFVGQHLCNRLQNEAIQFFAPTSQQCNLCNQSDTTKLLQMVQPDIVIHLAARVGGIGANQKSPGLFIHDNLVMGLNVIEASRLVGVSKFIMLGTVCMYPRITLVPFQEKDIWNGYPEATNASYGIAKRALIQTLMSYKQQYGFNSVNLIPVNMYGKRDQFNLETSHVIPSIILKVQNAIDQHSPSIQVWGTGQVSREFLYVEDCIDAISKAIQTDCGSSPINIGTGKEIKIIDLVKKICKIMKYDGQIVFDKSKPDGQPRRCLDTSYAEKVLNFKAKTTLDEGLEKTIKWFKNDRCNNI